MASAPSYSRSDLLLFTHVLDQLSLEAGGFDEVMRAKVGLRIAMGAASGLASVEELMVFAREAH